MKPAKGTILAPWARCQAVRGVVFRAEASLTAESPGRKGARAGPGAAGALVAAQSNAGAGSGTKPDMAGRAQRGAQAKSSRSMAPV